MVNNLRLERVAGVALLGCLRSGTDVTLCWLLRFSAARDLLFLVSIFGRKNEISLETRGLAAHVVVNRYADLTRTNHAVFISCCFLANMERD